MVWSSVARHLKTNLARALPSFLAWGFEMEGVLYEQRERINFIFTLAVYPFMPIALLPLACPSQLFRGGVAYGQMERIAFTFTCPSQIYVFLSIFPLSLPSSIPPFCPVILDIHFPVANFFRNMLFSKIFAFTFSSRIMRSSRYAQSFLKISSILYLRNSFPYTGVA